MKSSRERHNRRHGKRAVLSIPRKQLGPSPGSPASKGTGHPSETAPAAPSRLNEHGSPGVTVLPIHPVLAEEGEQASRPSVPSLSDSAALGDAFVARVVLTREVELEQLEEARWLEEPGVGPEAWRVLAHGGDPGAGTLTHGLEGAAGRPERILLQGQGLPVISEGEAQAIEPSPGSEGAATHWEERETSSWRTAADELFSEMPPPIREHSLDDDPDGATEPVLSVSELEEPELLILYQEEDSSVAIETLDATEEEILQDRLSRGAVSGMLEQEGRDALAAQPLANLEDEVTDPRIVVMLPDSLPDDETPFSADPPVTPLLEGELRQVEVLWSARTLGQPFPPAGESGESTGEVAASEQSFQDEIAVASSGLEAIHSEEIFSVVDEEEDLDLSSPGSGAEVYSAPVTVRALPDSPEEAGDAAETSLTPPPESAAISALEVAAPAGQTPVLALGQLELSRAPDSLQDPAGSAPQAETPDASVLLPPNMRGCLRAIVDASSRHDWMTMTRLFERARALDPDDGRPYALLGAFLIRAGALLEARGLLATGIQRARPCRALYETLLETELRLERTESARSLLRLLLVRFPHHRAAVVRWVPRAVELGELGLAEQLLEEAHSQGAGVSEALLAYEGLLLSRAGSVRKEARGGEAVQVERSSYHRLLEGLVNERDRGHRRRQLEQVREQMLVLKEECRAAG